MAQPKGLLQSGRGVSGSAFFTGGMSSAADPMFIDDRSVRAAMNVVHRGGVLKTRPGYRQIAALEDGKLQGFTYFKPLEGLPQLVAVVGGNVYASRFPFSTFTQVAGISLYDKAPRVFFAVATRSAELQEDGTILAVAPKRMLMIQDGGFSKPVWFDGGSGGTLDPGADQPQTPLGGPMAWSGDRLWVARKNKLFAGNISDPFSFTENLYAAEGGFFIFPEDITALAEVKTSDDSSVLVVFTANSMHAIKTSYRDRTTWKEVPNFQYVVHDSVGCVGHRAVVSQFGLLWWMSSFGLVNLNTATQSKISSQLAPQDTEMSVSKFNLGANLRDVALGWRENYLLASVPYGDKYNRHTWVLDNAAVGQVESAASRSWSGFWTGTRPVEWATGPCNGVQRTFYASVDLDGTNRVWESFMDDRQDNDGRITAFVETKTHIDFSQLATGLDLKRLVFAELRFEDIVGDVDVSVYWAGSRGKYHKWGDWKFKANRGSVPAGADLPASITNYRPQSRVIRTPELSDDGATACSSCGIESKYTDRIDQGFSLLIVWTGRAALRSYRIFVDPYEDPSKGDATTDESQDTNRTLDGVICSETP